LRPQTPQRHIVGAAVFIMSVGSVIALGQASLGRAPSASANTPTGSLRGRILDADSGQPVTQTLRVDAADGAGRRVGVPVDVQGEYSLRDLAPAQYEIRVYELDNRFPIASRIANVESGIEKSGADVSVRLRGVVGGVALDDDGEPVSGAKILLVSAEYWFGQLIYTAEQVMNTDDRGQYKFSRSVEASHSYLILVLPPDMIDLDAPIASLNPRTRRSVLAATWYPGPPTSSGEVRFALSSGEHKRIDVQMAHAPSYCVDGTLTADGRPAALDFEVAIAETSGYSPSTGRTRGEVRGGRSSPDGQFRVCGLWPGEFRLRAGISTMYFGQVLISIGSKDLKGLMLDARSPVTVAGEIVWDTYQLNNPRLKTAALRLTPISRAPLKGEALSYASEVAVPSRLNLTLPPSTEYVITMRNSGDAYVKSVSCDGVVLTDRFYVGEGGGCKLKITLGTDTGTVAVTVVDKENKPVLNGSVCMVPASVANKEQVSGESRCVPIDPDTGASSIRLRPGKYIAVVQPAIVSDWVEYVWKRSAQGVVVDIVPGTSGQITLKNNAADH
jgi:hypothetical protein